MSNGFQVCSERCDECLFSKQRIVSKVRMLQVLRECTRKDAHFLCHKHTIEGREVCCKGFYDKNPMQTKLMRIAHRLNMIRFVDLDGNPVTEE